MTREELLLQIKLIKEFVSVGRPNRPGVSINPSKITIHNTSNRNAKADAKAHSRFVRDTGFYTTKDPQSGEEKKHWVSWHFTVDDKIAIIHLPVNEMAYHAGQAANISSISIEICMNEGINQEQANERAAKLVALLCYDHAIPLTGVVSHKFWTGKNCPELLLGSWKNFTDKVAFYFKDIKDTMHLDSIPKDDRNFNENVEIPLCWTQKLEPTFLLDTSDEKNVSSLSVQEGFNTTFLNSGKVSLPNLNNDKDHVFIHHQNMTIYFNKVRKLALYTSCNYDKSLLIPMKRSDSFRDDPFLDIGLQLGQGFYGSPTLDISPKQNYFDRGHLIARRYNQWGSTVEEARHGERDTYFFTTIHPQVKELNQDEWENLESFIIESGKLDVQCVSIITGALLHPNDPIATYEDAYYKEQRSIKIPLVYWKVVYYEVDNELRRIGFLMSQRNRLKEIDFVQFEDKAQFVEDPFNQIGDPLKTYIIRCDLIENATGLKFSEAKELYDKEEPLEIVIKENETHMNKLNAVESNILKYI